MHGTFSQTRILDRELIDGRRAGIREVRRMHIIIVGCGRIGAALAKSLSLEGHDVVVVAEDPESFERLGSSFNGATVRGLGFDEEVLREAGVERADALAAVTDNDDDNLMVAEIAQRVFRVKRVIGRAYDPDREKLYALLNIDVVCGARLVSAGIIEMLGSTHLHHVMSMDGTELVRFRTGPVVEGLTIRAVQDRFGVSVCAVTRAGSTFVPPSHGILHSGDVVLGTLMADDMSGMHSLVEAR
jgi:trk system potassium uptake protein TrkA